MQWNVSMNLAAPVAGALTVAGSSCVKAQRRCQPVSAHRAGFRLRRGWASRYLGSRSVAANAASPSASDELGLTAEYGELDEVHMPLPFDSAFRQVFLDRYWQKRPVLIRQAVPGFSSPVEPQTLNLLAEDAQMSTRLILERGETQPWELIGALVETIWQKWGPFTVNTFNSLPETHYSLLVDDMDRHNPEVQALYKLFPFIPRYRFSDIMISSSPAFGSVGPHSDNYDVFLLQANGRKSWAVSSDPKYDPDNADAHEEGPMVRILKEWQAQAQRVLMPGDMLYLPPKVAHHGVGLEPNLTYSVGCRSRTLPRVAAAAASQSAPLVDSEFGDLDEIKAELPFTPDFQEEFLSKYWQKRPLLIRQAVPNFRSPVEPEELAGLACEEMVSTRLILEKDGKQPWELRYGPFDFETFETLPKTHYSLLVEGVDRHVPAVADLFALFPFIPRWRFDDIMVSYSPTSGSVGPHSDNYDVFLLQANGRKSWAVSSDPKYDPDDPDAHEEGPMVRILKEWQAQAQRVLMPGDMLYIPPKVAHHGVALEKGLTLSVGCLAPKETDLVISYVDTIAMEEDLEFKRWRDPALKLQPNSGEISAAALDQASAVLQNLLQDRSHIAKWLGSFLTEPQGGPDPQPLKPEMDWKEFVATLNDLGEVRLLESVRAAYMSSATQGEHNPSEDRGLLFVQGQAAECTGTPMVALAVTLADKRRLTTNDLQAAQISTQKAARHTLVGQAQELILSMMNEGFLYFLGEEGFGGEEMLGEDEGAEGAEGAEGEWQEIEEP